MSIEMSPYLNFPPGQTRAAMEFYQGVFGGELTVLGFGDFGMEGMPADGVMHAALRGEHATIYASDAMPGAEHSWQGTRNYISLMGDELDRMTSWFDQLATGGRVPMPLGKQVWGDTYGHVVDPFGIEWLFNIAEPG
ncbi:MAG: glyoxalase/bleomycin resistance/extradiol dioxygenase family protein [Nocardioides sp.]